MVRSQYLLIGTKKILFNDCSLNCASLASCSFVNFMTEPLGLPSLCPLRGGAGGSRQLIFWGDKSFYLSTLLLKEKKIECFNLKRWMNHLKFSLMKLFLIIECYFFLVFKHNQ